MRTRLALSLLATIGTLQAASAEEISLRPRYQQGDGYVLSLSAVKSSELLARGDAGRPFREDVHLRYEANVVVLETDAAGIPLRERHRDVALTYARPDGSGSLFGAPSAYEVRRANGDVEIFVAGERAPRELERVVAELLAEQFEYGIGALLDPGRPVAVGERWELERGQVRRFLRQRGVEGVRLGGPASASLEREDGRGLLLRYSIPMQAFRPSALPPNARPARSQGSLEGELRLEPERARTPLRHSSKLALRVQGSVFGAGVAPSFPFRFESSEALDQHTLTVRRDQVAASF